MPVRFVAQQVFCDVPNPLFSFAVPGSSTGTRTIVEEHLIQMMAAVDRGRSAGR